MAPNRDGESRDQVRLGQLEQLQMLLNRAYLNVDFYRRRMDRLGLQPEDIATFEDFRRFPFTTSGDLAAHYPYGLFAVPLKSVVRLKITHSRDGSPVVVGFTRRDIQLWQNLMARLYTQLGVTDRDIVQVAYNYSLFPGAFTFNHAAEQIGATLAPSAMTSATLQLKIMQDFRSTVLATTPSFAVHILSTLKAARNGRIGQVKSDLRLLLLGPEPVPDETRKLLHDGLQAEVHGLYGVSEMIEPGIAGECRAGSGYHLAEEHFLAEIVHPVSGQPVPAGQEGELVITTLAAEAYPLIRYRTGDVTVLRETPCACGRGGARLGEILRRTDDRLSIRGIPCYPAQIGNILRGLDPSISDFRLLVHRRFGLGDHLDILVARADGQRLAADSRGADLDQMRSTLRRVLGFGARLQIVAAADLPAPGLIEKTVFLDT